MGSAPSSIQSGGPGRTAAGNSASIRALSNREPTMRTGWTPDGPAEQQASTPRLPRAHLAKGAIAPQRTPRWISSARSNREPTMRAVCAPDGPAERRATPSRLPRRHLATGASAPRLKTRGIYSALSNREPTMRPASASRANLRGICSPISNRELLGLEILQLIENKHHRPVLIANFEPFCAQQNTPSHDRK
jgi:hypothetical protein